MGLYNKYLDFPKKIHQGRFVAALILLYALFTLNPNKYLQETTIQAIVIWDYTINPILFFNDFTIEGSVAYFVTSMYYYFYLLVITYAATVHITHRLFKSMFYAATIDSIISIINVIIFGSLDLTESAIIRNVFVILALLYAYFILADHDN